MRNNAQGTALVPLEEHWLVEIRVKDWISLKEGESPIVTFEEVLALNEIDARQKGFDQFETRGKYEPVMKRILMRRSLHAADCCAADAVQVS